ncbi:MAG: glycosyltransferase family A protein, partial [bacterium]
MKKPLINILTRTSNRPNYFRNCFESVKNQTYDNINHIISVDDDITEEYVKKYTDNYIKVKRTGVKKPPVGVRRYAPYNLYLNYLKNQVKDGWIMFLDDDDSFTNNDSLESIVNKIENVNQLLLWKVEFPGRIIPNNNIFNKKIIVLNNFSMIGFMYHKKYDDIMFDDYSGGDFYFMKNLFPKIPNKIWVDEIYTKVQRNNMGGFGKRDDLK